VIHARITESEIRQLLSLAGDGDREVQGIATLDEAMDDCLYFVNMEVTAPLRERLAERRGCVVIARMGSALSGEWRDCVVLESPDPRASIARVLGFIRAEGRQPPLVAERRVSPKARVSPLAVVEGNVEIEDGVVIEPFCMIETDVKIGRGTTIRSGVRLFSRVEIGEETIIGANTVIGHDGYGYVRNEEGNKEHIPHLGGVRIGSHVEISALTIVHAGVIIPTTVEDHAKVGEHNVVAHNCRIGRGASVTAGVVMGGRSVIGAEAWVGLNTTIRDGGRVGERALVGMDVSVQEDIPDGAVARAPRPEIQTRTDIDPAAIGFQRRAPGPYDPGIGASDAPKLKRP
jgi:UDP-3-O-[3-hydroxymyristoyl] glucosamine N-acyltransferase